MTDITNVLIFPSKEVRDWTIIERSITEYCSANTFSPLAQERLTGVMKTFWESLDPGLNFSFDIPFPNYLADADRIAIQDAVARQVSRANGEILQRFTNRLYIERFTREVDFLHDLGLIG